jgi:hypothetical protein
VLRRDFLGAGAAAIYDVTRYGARGDGVRNDRIPLQRAIDECARRGGGTVWLPPGRYKSGSLRLRSGVALWLDHGATLVASADPRDYEIRSGERTPRDGWGSVFLLAENAEHVALGGHGVIQGAGLAQPRAAGQPLAPFRPRLVAFEHCRDVVVDGITLREADRWTLHLYHSDSVRITRLRILARYDVVNTDGIDIDGCRNVVVSGCEIVCGDDCIVIKTTNYLGDPRPVENVSVTNCVLSTRAAGFKVGTETHADISNVSFSNSVVYGAGPVRPNSVISLAMVDGARLSSVSVTNVTGRHVLAPVFVRLGDRSRTSGQAAPGRLEQVIIQNLVVEDATQACVISGIPGACVRGITLSDLRIQTSVVGEPWPAERRVPERESAYPRPDMFGPLPALGLYARHVRGLVVRNFDLEALTSAALPLLVTEDVEALDAQGLRMNGAPVAAKTVG